MPQSQLKLTLKIPLFESWSAIFKMGAKLFNYYKVVRIEIVLRCHELERLEQVNVFITIVIINSTRNLNS